LSASDHHTTRGEARPFSWSVRVYYEDTDVGGMVYYANYLRFMERARTEWLRQLGYDQDRLMDEEDLIFAVRSVSVEYIRPARFNELLEVSVEPLELGRASIQVEQRVTRCSETGQGALLSRGQVRLVSLTAGLFRPRPIPKRLREDLQSAC
jgi:acyl-CoA thioester hydrolase